MFGSKRQPGNKAYWIEHAHILRSDYYECSNCHVEARSMTANCPKCGARMMKSEYDPQWVDELEMFDAIFGE